MMSQRSKRELFEAIRPRYLKAKKAEKTRILDEFIASIGYHRKYAILPNISKIDQNQVRNVGIIISFQ